MTAATFTVPLRSSCARCGMGVAADSRFCSTCGTALLADGGRAPVDVATRRTIRLAALTVAANIVVGAATFGVVLLVSGAPRYVTAALLLEALHFLVVGALALLTLRSGARAVTLTRDGRTRLSPLAVLAMVVAGLVMLSLFVSLGLVAAMDTGLL